MRGITAGAIGGVLLQLYLIVTIVFIMHQTDAGTILKFIASAIMGTNAFASPISIWIGLFMHYIIAMAWGAGYAFVAASAPQVMSRPVTSGIAFGVIVWFVMQVIEMTVGIWTMHPINIANSLVGHVLCFGLPVAYVFARWPFSL